MCVNLWQIMFWWRKPNEEMTVRFKSLYSVHPDLAHPNEGEDPTPDKYC